MQALKFAEQIAGALVAAHERGIIHRDIKPENIMIRPDGYLKVLDFGLAKSLPNALAVGNAENRSEQIINTMPGMVMGSVRYMSPEQARGNPVDARTDVWSLGAVLYEMLAGRAAFEGATTSDTLAAVVYLEPAPLERFLPEAPQEIVRIVRKTLQKDADRRYQTSKDLLLDLKTALYDIEHEISLENKTQILPGDFHNSENATKIHQTASASHRTHVSNINNSTAQKVALGRNGFAAIILLPLVGVVLLAALAFGFYNWFAVKPNRAATAFERTQISRVNSDGKVSVPAISPDGKYLSVCERRNRQQQFGRAPNRDRQFGNNRAADGFANQNRGFFADRRIRFLHAQQFGFQPQHFVFSSDARRRIEKTDCGRGQRTDFCAGRQAFCFQAPCFGRRQRHYFDRRC